MKFEGVLHEFSTLPDVLEDVSDIILNLKQVRFRQYNSEALTLKINKKGPGVVTAADIQTSDKIEILNPHQHIATLGNNGNFNAELIVSYGRGYIPVENSSEELPVVVQ